MCTITDVPTYLQAVWYWLFDGTIELIPAHLGHVGKVRCDESKKAKCIFFAGMFSKYVKKIFVVFVFLTFFYLITHLYEVLG